MKPLKEAIQEAQNKLCRDYGLDFTLKVMVHGLPKGEEAKTIKRIFSAIESVTMFTESDIKSESTKRDLCDARYIAMYMLRFKARLNLNQVGFYVSRDHTTVPHGISRYFDLIKIDENFRNMAERVSQMVPDATATQSKQRTNLRFTKAA